MVATFNTAWLKNSTDPFFCNFHCEAKVNSKTDERNWKQHHGSARISHYSHANSKAARAAQHLLKQRNRRRGKFAVKRTKGEKFQVKRMQQRALSPSEFVCTIASFFCSGSHAKPAL